MYFYTDFSLAGNFDVQIDLYYKNSWTGTFASENQMVLMQGDGVTPWVNYTLNGKTDTVRNILSASGISTFNLFTGSNFLCTDQPEKPNMLSHNYTYAICSGSEIMLNASSSDNRLGIVWQWQQTHDTSSA